MQESQKEYIVEYIKSLDPKGDVVTLINPGKDFRGGEIRYNSETIFLHRSISDLNDEEYVRAYLAVKLVKELGYYSDEKIIELEKGYSIGRPNKKSARVDLLVRYPSDWPEEEKRSKVFLFIECKTPEKFEEDKRLIRGQVFRLSRQEDFLPEYGLYYSAFYDSEKVLDKSLIIDFSNYPTWEDWDKYGQPSNSVIPESFGIAKNVEYANIDSSDELRRPLRTDVTRAEFDRLRKELHGGLQL